MEPNDKNTKPTAMSSSKDLKTLGAPTAARSRSNTKHAAASRAPEQKQT